MTKSRWPKLDRRADARVLEILHGGKVGPGGEWCGRFERDFAAWLGVRRALAVTNGTSALQLALEAMGVGPGDEVICTSYSFIASSFAILLTGAQPVFCDVGDDHLIDISRAEKLVNRRTKAVLVVHLYGIVAEMGPILEFARRHRLRVVEDCAQCLGGEWNGRKAGTIGDIGCFSFCQTKHITTAGEGGMVAVNDEALAERVRWLRDNVWGFTMTEIQAAVGHAALQRFDRWDLPRRRLLGRALIDGLVGHPLVKAVPPDTERRRNAFWLVPFLLRSELLTIGGFDFVKAVQAEGAGAYAILWPEMYREEAFQMRRGFGPDNCPFDDPRNRRIDYGKVLCPKAHSMTDSVIGFWAHPTRTLGEVRRDVAAFGRVAARFMRPAAKAALALAVALMMRGALAAGEGSEWSGFTVEGGAAGLTTGEFVAAFDCAQSNGMNAVRWPIADTNGWRIASVRHRELPPGLAVTNGEVRVWSLDEFARIVYFGYKRGIAVVPALEPGELTPEAMALVADLTDELVARIPKKAMPVVDLGGMDFPVAGKRKLDAESRKGFRPYAKGR